MDLSELKLVVLNKEQKTKLVSPSFVDGQNVTFNVTYPHLIIDFINKDLENLTGYLNFNIYEQYLIRNRKEGNYFDNIHSDYLRPETSYNIFLPL